MRASLVPILCISLVLCACPKRPGPKGQADPDESWTEHMQEHLRTASAVRDGLMAGELARAQQVAGELTVHPTAVGMPDTWMPMVDAFRDEAHAVSAAVSLAEAAQAATRLADACGQCHAETEGKLRFEEVPKPTPSEGMEDHMVRNQWCLERMWEGLIARSDARWEFGAALLTEGPIFPGDPEGYGPEVVRMARQAQNMAGQTNEVRWSERARVLGEVISACGGCHVAAAGPAD
jgi:cytochrome c553